MRLALSTLMLLVLASLPFSHSQTSLIPPANVFPKVKYVIIKPFTPRPFIVAWETTNTSLQSTVLEASTNMLDWYEKEGTVTIYVTNIIALPNEFFRVKAFLTNQK